MQTLNDTLVLVTGSASGIGRATATALARSGARVVVADIQQSVIEEVAAEIRSAGGTVMAVQMNVADQQSVERAFDAVERDMGDVVALVNCAGVRHVAPLLEYRLADWERVMSVNMTGTFLCAQRAARSMVRNRYGRIVNVASIAGMQASMNRIAYGTSKAAVIGLTRQLAVELAPHGVTCNAVAPGAVITPMTAADFDAGTKADYESLIPARRLGETRDIADAIMYLISPAAGYVNGQTLAVDGGAVAGSGLGRTTARDA